MRSATPTMAYQVVVAGARLRMVVLASDGDESVGVDLGSGALVRASHPPAADVPEPFEVMAGEIAGAVEPFDAGRPEAIELCDPPELVGSFSPRRAERLLARLHHPPQLPLLGLAANAVPYWTLEGDRPSVTVVSLRNDAKLFWGQFGPECHFSWQGVDHDLLLTDYRGVAALESNDLSRPTRADVAQLLGYRPRRLLVMLTRPIDGYCHKAVAALLPGRR
ncbi:MAG: hypothetical protein AB1673_04670 [Actinomycetota bacterium]